MITFRNGFVKSKDGQWINISRIFGFGVMEIDEVWCVMASIELDNGIRIAEYQSKEEAQKVLDDSFLHANRKI